MEILFLFSTLSPRYPLAVAIGASCHMCAYKIDKTFNIHFCESTGINRLCALLLCTLDLDYESLEDGPFLFPKGTILIHMNRMHELK